MSFSLEPGTPTGDIPARTQGKTVVAVFLTPKAVFYVGEISQEYFTSGMLAEGAIQTKESLKSESLAPDGERILTSSSLTLRNGEEHVFLKSSGKMRACTPVVESKNLGTT
ncbi:hypothetical protein ACFX2K_034971 [Malus domestica]